MNKKTKIEIVADFFAIGGSMIGSMLIASNTGHIVEGYIAFIVGGAATYYLLHKCEGSWSLKFITIFFFIVNIVGVVRYNGTF